MASGSAKVFHDFSLLTEEDIYLFKEGSHFQLFNKLGAHLVPRGEEWGVCFAVWAPNAERVSVMGDFNNWNRESHQLSPRWDSSGIWEGFIPGVNKGCRYKYFIKSRLNGFQVEKSDPYAFYSEVPPKTSSIVWDPEYTWHDEKWLKDRHDKNALNAPYSIYEIHLGSWRRKAEAGSRFLTYKEMAQELPAYLNEMGFTHVEIMPAMEHPFYGSWGYQSLGYFTPSSRYGTPEDFMFLVDTLHQHNIGVILDWVPSHFPSDEHGLVYFDGSHVYEYEDPQKGFHPDWKSYIFNNGRNEVKEFLISSAFFWLEKFHADGLRVDAVASMLYLDYSRKDGEWSPNIYGGRDNIESIAFIKRLNEVIYQKFPGVQMIAEESTAWANVSRPTFTGGLGFGMKWNMGWMHDTLLYFSKDPVHRKYHHNDLTFSMLYAYTENFVLSLSHDEVVHGKGSLWRKMPGDEWQKFANLRLLFGYMYGHPGKKLLFMGSEFGQTSEWYHEQSLDWHLLQYEPHAGLHKWMKALNHFYLSQPALYKCDFEYHGFEWLHCGDWEQSILVFLRKNPEDNDSVLVVCNFTPNPHSNYRIGVPQPGFWREILNSDSKEFYGTGLGNGEGVATEKIPCYGKKFSVSLTLPPLSVIFLKREKRPEDIFEPEEAAIIEKKIFPPEERIVRHDRRQR